MANHQCLGRPAVGGRYEAWDSDDGYFHDYARGNLQDHVDRVADRFSPKFSIGFAPNDDWRFRYAWARPYRFPIVEELFQNERRTASASIANANLQPEDGLHHNLLLERVIPNGYVRVNLFHEVIDDVIFNQTAIIDNRALNTFLPVDEVTTQGVEFIYNQYNILDKLDIRFNVTYVDAEITENPLNPARVGKTFPRLPDWRSHLLLTWHINGRWDVGGGIRYASDSFGDLDNSDTVDNVFGAQDAYTQINLKTSYRFNDRTAINLGVDDLTDEIAYVHHPWPGRTVFMEAALDY